MEALRSLAKIAAIGLGLLFAVSFAINKPDAAAFIAGVLALGWAGKWAFEHGDDIKTILAKLAKVGVIYGICVLASFVILGVFRVPKDDITVWALFFPLLGYGAFRLAKFVLY